MREVKGVEIRDTGTTIPALAIKVIGGAEDRLLWRAGFGEWPCIILIHLTSQQAFYDPYAWPGRARTMHVAHLWLVQHWDEHVDGGVVDVEFIQGERAEPKEPECGGPR